jgi:hypothetical protein
VCISFMASLEELRARFGPSRLSTLLSSAFCLKLFPLPKLQYICSVFGDKCMVPPKELDPTLPPLATVMSFAGPNLADSMSSDGQTCEILKKNSSLPYSCLLNLVKRSREVLGYT